LLSCLNVVAWIYGYETEGGGEYGKMDVLLETARKTGDLLVAVRFGKDDKNFCIEELKWWPKLDELNKLHAARRLVMEAQRKEVKEKELINIPS
jgi:hypothetical protein